MSSAAAQYKKKDGTLSVSADVKTVSWEAAGGVLAPLAIAIADIGSKSLASYEESGSSWYRSRSPADARHRLESLYQDRSCRNLATSW